MLAYVGFEVWNTEMTRLYNAAFASVSRIRCHRHRRRRRLPHHRFPHHRLHLHRRHRRGCQRQRFLAHSERPIHPFHPHRHLQSFPFVSCPQKFLFN